ncbi:hypothetical protein [Methylorubrum extorquens]|uniref:Uncharacterized protein n=1 Tax=Methylorubrum extorquens TaxID=408 RepID=A0AAX3WD92_METEX|nr:MULTISPECIES: hypothetical protein [Methylobacteriaceae]KQQ21512.1 hypothetical protein ASF56_18340 [Methylobacterium sp. Leaf122]WHQ68555.1 hypothetical protein KEC54_19525 [Methylorubrum extorquens]
MTRPTDDLSGHLTSLDNRAGLAALLPDVPEPRLVLLRAIRTWARAHAPNSRLLPRDGTIEAAAIEREIRALHEFIEADRRANPYVGTHRQSTTACGAGPEPGPDWPHW